METTLKRSLIALSVIVWLAPAIAVAADAPASAAVTLPDWVSAPPAEAYGYPTDKVKGLVPRPSGEVVVKCHRHENGDLDHCHVTSETPKNLGFGDAATIAISQSRAVSPPSSAIAPDGDILVSVAFDGHADEAARGARPGVAVILNPDWKTKPSPSELMGLYPAAATRTGRGGVVRVACSVSVEGLLDRCRVVSETPEGYGFGSAALLAARYFSMRPRTVDGQAVGGAVVIIPITFGGAAGDGGFTGPAIKILNAPVWAETPTPAMVEAAFPKSATDVAVGHVVLRCAIERDGRITACEDSTEEPRNRGFVSAARGLVKTFRVKMDAYPGIRVWEAKVDLPITFYAPGGGRTDDITEPFWVRMIDPAAAQRLFPSKAAAAGLKSGKGVVDCIIDHAGQLTGCQAVSETPADLGFGDAAVQVAGALAINPWTPQGRPVDGARIRLPLTLELSADAQPDVAKGLKP